MRKYNTIVRVVIILSNITEFETFQEHHLHEVESIPPHQFQRAVHRTPVGGPIEVEVSLP